MCNGCIAYNFDKLRDGDLKLYSDGVRDILHWSDELVISSEQFPEQPVFCLGWKAVWTDRKGTETKKERGQNEGSVTRWVYVNRTRGRDIKEKEVIEEKHAKTKKSNCLQEVIDFWNANTGSSNQSQNHSYHPQASKPILINLSHATHNFNMELREK